MKSTIRKNRVGLRSSGMQGSVDKIKILIIHWEQRRLLLVKVKGIKLYLEETVNENNNFAKSIAIQNAVWHLTLDLVGQRESNGLMSTGSCLIGASFPSNVSVPICFYYRLDEQCNRTSNFQNNSTRKLQKVYFV